MPDGLVTNIEAVDIRGLDVIEHEYIENLEGTVEIPVEQGSGGEYRLIKEQLEQFFGNKPR